MTECQCVTRHSPANPPIEGHHYPPSSYPLKPGGKRLVLRMCSNAHGINHKLLNLYRAQMPEEGQEPKGAGSFSRYHRDIAIYAWSQTDKSRPIPRTIAHPTIVDGNNNY